MIVSITPPEFFCWLSYIFEAIKPEIIDNLLADKKETIDATAKKEQEEKSKKDAENKSKQPEKPKTSTAGARPPGANLRAIADTLAPNNMADSEDVSSKLCGYNLCSIQTEQHLGVNATINIFNLLTLNLW